MSYIEQKKYIYQKYVYLLSSYLEGFKKIGHNYNFRCPICGDSEKNKRKKRGWLLSNNDGIVFYCHNCGASMSLQNFIRSQNDGLYKQYVYELLQEKIEIDRPIVFETEPEEPKELTICDEFLSVCTPISKLHAKHPAVEYISSRKVPRKKFSVIYWMDTMQSVYKLDKAGKYANRISDEDGRIIFPQWSSKSLVGMSCRSIDPKNPKRYLIYKFDDKSPLIFGLYGCDGNVVIDKTKRIYVTEGAVDSLFFDNAFAVNGSDLPKIIDAMSSFDVVYIPDNEPRNKQIVAVYEKVIKRGSRVVIFPKNVNEKDINEMVLVHGNEYVKELVDDSVYEGLPAKLKLTDWRRC